MLPAGDPSKFVLWRWMPIEDPDSGELYLNRLYIFRTPIGGLMWHRIHGPDWGRDLHSHPWKWSRWSFLTLVVRGGYEEEVATIHEYGPEWGIHSERARTRKTGRVYAFRENDVHRISSVKPNTATLVWSMPKPKGRTWGFYVEDEQGARIVRWSEYVNGAR